MGLVDPVSSAFTAAMAVIASVSANTTIKAITPQQDTALSTYLFIALVYVLMYAGVRLHVPRHGQRLVAIGFSALATIALLVMSYVLVGHTDKVAPIGLGTTADALSEIGHLSAQEISRLREIDVTPGTKFAMDGGIDRWIYIAFETGLGYLEYNKIPVQEKGVYYFYAFVMSMFGSYGIYFMLVVNWALHVGSTALVYLISKRIFGPTTAIVTASIYAIIPENLYFAGVIHKDIQVVFLVLVFTYSVVTAVYDKRSQHYLFVALTLLAMAFERSGLVLPLFAAGLVAHFFGGRPTMQRIPLYFAALAVVTFTSWTVLPQPVLSDIKQKTVSRILDKMEIGSSEHLDVENIEYTTTKEESMVQRFGGGDISLGTIYYVPIRVIMYLLAPFPPIFPRFDGDYYIYPSAYIIAAFSMFFAIGMVLIPATWRGPATILAMNFIVLGLALSFSGPFVYERYRLMLTPFYFLIATPVLVLSTPRRRVFLFSLSIALWILAVLVWLWFK